MYLLNAQQISHYVNEMPFGSYLDITNFRPHALQHTTYYFALGRNYDVIDGDNPQPKRLTNDAKHLVLPARGYVTAKSYESFQLSDKVMGVLGAVSDLAKRGLQLVHSPFIDPIFRGPLTVGIYNCLDREVVLKLGTSIGKVSFFDISDTYPVGILTGSVQERKFKQLLGHEDDDPIPTDDEDDSELYGKKPWQS